MLVDGVDVSLCWSGGALACGGRGVPQRGDVGPSHGGHACCRVARCADQRDHVLSRGVSARDRVLGSEPTVLGCARACAVQRQSPASRALLRVGCVVAADGCCVR
eukprot:Amastigsp_a841985_178.p3 type:complete len:105 gc:universal Amastigsp_a841985_178:872-558(-)